jgi:hypothetical protein
MPREALDNIYNQLTDVYAFGVTLWEIYSFGQTPYRELSNQQVLENISIRDVLQCPSACPSNIYGMIVECKLLFQFIFTLKFKVVTNTRTDDHRLLNSTRNCKFGVLLAIQLWLEQAVFIQVSLSKF